MVHAIVFAWFIVIKLNVVCGFHVKFFVHVRISARHHPKLFISAVIKSKVQKGSTSNLWTLKPSATKLQLQIPRVLPVLHTYINTKMPSSTFILLAPYVLGHDWMWNSQHYVYNHTWPRIHGILPLACNMHVHCMEKQWIVRPSTYMYIAHYMYVWMHILYLCGRWTKHAHILIQVDHTASIRCVVLLYVIEDLLIIHSPAVLVM